MTLIGGAFSVLFSAVSLSAAVAQQQPVPSVAPSAAQDRVPVARRVAATAQLAAQEYRAGVVGGRVVA